MRYSQLRAFHHVALLGGFSRAAEALRISQPAISEQVRKLEQDHDVLLFYRDRRNVRLTTAGEELLRLTRGFFETERQIADYLSESRAALEGELRIIADAAHHITDILTRFRRRHPGITVTLSAGNTEEILDALRSYKAEIGVVGSPPPGGDMETLELSTTEIVAFAAHDLVPPSCQSFRFRELADWPLIWREEGSKTRQKLADEAARQKIKLRPAISAEGRETVREVVASGAGIGFVSRAEYRHDDRMRLLPLTDADLSMTEVMAHLTQRRDVRVIRAFMDIARDRPAA